MWWRLFTPRVREQEADPPQPKAKSVAGPEEKLLTLQRQVGNRAVQRLITSGERTASQVPERRSGGQPLDPAAREQLESKYGDNLGDVRVHTDDDAEAAAESLDAAAFTSGNDILVGRDRYEPDTAEGQSLLAHEVAHVLQQRRFGPADRDGPLVTDPDDASEREADRATDAIAEGEDVRVAAAPTASIARQPDKTPPTAKGTTQYWPGQEPKPGLPPTQTVFEDPAGGTPQGARKALDEYKKMAPGNRRAAFDFSYPKGSVARVLKALPPEDAAGPAYRDTVRELLRWVEEVETRIASGKTEDQMADVEAKYVQAQAEADARAAAAAKKSAKAPSAADVEAARQERVKAAAYKPAEKTRWQKLTDAKRKEWTDRGTKAIAKLVAYAAKAHPALKLTPANMVLGFDEIDKVMLGALAVSAGPGLARVGFEFVEVVDVNPAYALSTVIHEGAGHPEFDDPGGNVNYQLALFDKAAAKIPGYTSDRDTEFRTYQYHESEIYAYLRELPYWTPVGAKDAKFSRLNPDPKQLMAYQFDQIKAEWEPSLAAALMHGLYRRFKLDPRIEATALAAFENVVKAKFPGQAKDILK